MIGIELKLLILMENIIENRCKFKEILKTACMKGNGWMGRKMGVEFRYGQMEPDMMDNGKMELIMDMDG